MTMVFETVQTEGIAQLSYLMGDDQSGTAAVIDPRPQCRGLPSLGARKRSRRHTHLRDASPRGLHERCARTGRTAGKCENLL